MASRTRADFRAAGRAKVRIDGARIRWNANLRARVRGEEERMDGLTHSIFGFIFDSSRPSARDAPEGAMRRRRTPNVEI